MFTVTPEKHYEFFKIATFAYTFLFRQFNESHKYTCDTAPVCAENVCEQLIADHNSLWTFYTELFNCFNVSGWIRLLGIAYVFRVDVFDKAQDSFLIVIRKKKCFKSGSVNLYEQLIYFRRWIITVMYKSIIYVEYNSAAAFFMMLMVDTPLWINYKFILL